MKKSHLFDGFLACAMALSVTVAADAADLDLLRRLVAIPSVSTDTQQVRRVMRAMREYLEPKGVHCVIETHPNGKDVLYASTTPGKNHDVVISSHLDVVPAVTPDQYVMRTDGPDKLIGRGVGDCKGCCVAVAEALPKLVGRASVGCIFGADEELGGATTTWMVEERGYGPRRMALVVDGTYNAVVYAIKGQTMFRIRAKGRGGHSSAPWNADDNILVITKAYCAIREAWDRKYPLAADKWSDVLSATVIRSEGDAMNRIPDDVSLVMNLRSIRPESKDEALKLIHEVSGLDVEVIRHSPPCSSDPGDPLVLHLQSVLRDVNGADVVLKRANYATDARCFASCGLPTVTIGIKEGDAHGRDEWATVSSIDQMRESLVRFCMTLPKAK